MATALSDIRTECRALLQEASARFFTDAELNRWINFAVKDWTTRVQWYTRIVAQAVVANVFAQNLPSDILKIDMARWQDMYRIKTVDASSYAERTFLQNAPTSVPTLAMYYPHDKKIMMNPAPNASSPATQLNGAILAADTTITVDSTTGFQENGIILIDSEQIRYFGITATQFLNCQRGDGDTTAANHADNAAVTEGTLVLYTRAIPPALVADVDQSKIPDQWIMDICNYVAWRGNLKRNTEESRSAAREFQKQYLARREEAANERFQEQMDGTPGVKDEEFGMGFGADY